MRQVNQRALYSAHMRVGDAAGKWREIKRALNAYAKSHN